MQSEFIAYQYTLNFEQAPNKIRSEVIFFWARVADNDFDNMQKSEIGRICFLTYEANADDIARDDITRLKPVQPEDDRRFVAWFGKRVKMNVTIHSFAEAARTMQQIIKMIDKKSVFGQDRDELATLAAALASTKYRRLELRKDGSFKWQVFPVGDATVVFDHFWIG